jgi:hypothetical protein
VGGPPFVIFEGWGFVLLTGIVHPPLRKTLYLNLKSRKRGVKDSAQLAIESVEAR